jgi:cysteinyl-tRNA synthetase
VRDFALWKAAKPEDEQVGAVWDTPWGRAARLAHRVLRDEHGRARRDLRHPLRRRGPRSSPTTRTRSPSPRAPPGSPSCATGCTASSCRSRARRWPSPRQHLHPRDLLERGVRPSSIRYTFLTAHYRSKLNFTFEALAAAAEAVRRLRATRDRLREHPAVPDARPRRRAPPARGRRRGARRLRPRHGRRPQHQRRPRRLFGLVTRGQRPPRRARHPAPSPTPSGRRARRLRAHRPRPRPPLPRRPRAGRGRPRARRLGRGAARRPQAARAARDFARADAIRDELAARGVVVEDTPTGRAGAFCGLTPSVGKPVLFSSLARRWRSSTGRAAAL